MNKLVKGNLVKGLPSKLFENDQTCVACQKGKQHRASCKSKTENSISLPLHLLHMDLFGPTFVKSLKKKMYCLVVTDDYSRFTWVFFLATKDETSGILKSFITRIENLVDHKVKVIRYRTPQQNGVAERRNRTLIEAARTMLADSKLPTTFWAEAVNTACYVQNRVLVVKPHNKTSYELFHGRTPTLSFMIPFGYPVTIINTIDHLGKFDGKVDEGFFVGYSLNSEAFRVFNSRTRIVEENLHIRFSESTPNVVASGPDWLLDINALTRTMNYEPIVADPKSSHNDGSKPLSDDGKKVNEDPRKDSKYDEDDGAVADMNNLDITIQVNPNPTTRIHKDHPLDQVIGDLQSATQTRKMSKNLEEHGKNPKRNKKNERGIMIINKARLVAQGYTQEEWINYDEVFALVARIEAIRLFLAYASFKDFVVYQMDVKSVFLYGMIEEEVHVCQPPGFEDPNFSDRVYKVEKALSMIGSLMYLTSSCLDIFAVCACASYTSQCKGSHLHAVKWIFGYLRSTKLAFGYLEIYPFNLVEYTDSDYAGASLDRKSTTGGKAKKSVRLMMRKLFGMELKLILVVVLGAKKPCEDTIAQTRFESVSKHSNDSLIARESSDNEESLGEDASKQGRIDAIDADEEITLVSVHDVNVSAGEEVFATTVDDITLAQVLEEMKSTKPKKKRVVIQELGESTTTISSQLSSQQSQDKGKGILIEPVKPMNKKDLIRLDEETALNLQAKFDEEERLTREKTKKEEEANISLIQTWDDIQAKIDADHQLAERMQAQEREELAEEKRNKPPTKAQQRKIMCTYLKNMEGYKLKILKLKEFDSIQEMFDRAFKRITKKQKVEDDKEIVELKQLMEIIPDEEEVAINAIPLAVKSSSIVGWKIYKEGRKSYYQIMRVDGKYQMYMIFSQMLKSFNSEDLEDLYKLVKAKYESTRPVKDLDLLLWGDLKTMFEPHVEDKEWKNQQEYKVLNWKLYDSCGVHSLMKKHVQIYMLVDKKYPLTPSTLSMMLEKKLIIDYESEMAYDWNVALI
ncbi:retrovirus-related pol polyprotein from transposon TNT 1-94 [Tanacetum coccineum]